MPKPCKDKLLQQAQRTCLQRAVELQLIGAGDIKKKASPSAKLAPLASSQSAPAIVGFEGFAGFEGFESLEFDDMSVGSLPSVGSSVLGGRISLGSMG